MDENKKTLSQTALSRRMERLFDKKATRSAPRDAALGLASALVAFLLANCALPFATYPLGLALLCASTERTLYIAAGLLAAAFTVPISPWISASVTLGTLLIRIAARVFVDLPTRIGGDGRRGELLEHLRGRLFCEGLYLRMACVCVAVFSNSLYAIIRGGFRYYDLFGAIFSMVAAPLSVFLFAGLFEGEFDRLFSSRIAKPLTVASRIALATALCYSLSDTTLAGVPLSLTFAFVAVLHLCRRHGLAASALTGLACGLTLGLPYPPILLVASLAAFCILDLSPMLAASVACIAGTVCGVLILGGSSVTSVFLPLFSGTAVYCTADKLVRTRAPSVTPAKDTNDTTARVRVEETRRQSEALATALTELSEVFSAMSERHLCGDEQTDSPRQAVLCSEKAESFSLDYRASATLLRELSAHLDDEFREDNKLAAAIRGRLSDLGYAVNHVSVTGTRQKKLTVTGITPSLAEAKLSYLGGQFARVSGFTWDKLILAEDGALTAVQAPSIRVLCGSSLSAKESVCGDVISLFRDEDRGFLYALLSDGMGTGIEAAETAQLSSLFLRKLLPVGVRPETALRMLNQFLRLGRNGGNTESSTTVDLLALDLIAGRASFLKSGAAPTYVKRGKNIFYLDSKTAPVGILKEIDAKQIDFDVKTGDTVVMVSDGITGGDSECLWLLDYLDATEENDPARIAERVVARAAEEDDPDDLSAIALLIDRAEASS